MSYFTDTRKIPLTICDKFDKVLSVSYLALLPGSDIASVAPSVTICRTWDLSHFVTRVWYLFALLWILRGPHSFKPGRTFCFHCKTFLILPPLAFLLSSYSEYSGGSTLYFKQLWAISVTNAENCYILCL